MRTGVRVGLAALGLLGCGDASPAADAAPGGSEPMSTQAAVQSRWLRYAGGAVHRLEAGAESGTPVLLLHGASFDAGTWQQLGTLGRLAAAGAHAVALDLPGYGKSEAVRVERASYLAGLLPQLGLERPVVVAPSLSGAFAFPLAESHPERIAGLVAVAPAQAAEYQERLAGSSVPTLILWGEQDRVFPVSLAAALARALPRSRAVVFSGAGHACYLDDPERFHRELLAFVGSLSSTRADTSR